MNKRVMNIEQNNCNNLYIQPDAANRKSHNYMIIEKEPNKFTRVSTILPKFNRDIISLNERIKCKLFHTPITNLIPLFHPDKYDVYLLCIT